jgi:Ca-activated chloride channel family protein
MSTQPATAPTGLIVAGTRPAPIPLQGVSVDAVLRDDAARVTLSQRYRNAESHPLEALYIFPVDECAAVCGFEAVIDGTRVVARVEEREKAFEAYDDALAAGHGAYLLDQEAPDVFTASIGNVPPGAEVLIRLTTVAELPLEGDDIRFVLPTTLSPRYAPESDQKGVGPTRADRMSPPLAWDVPYGLTLGIAVEMTGRIRSVESPSHSIRVEGLVGGRARVELATRETALDRDFVLKIGLEEPAKPRALLEAAPDGRAHVLASFRPTFESGDEARTEVVFVVDRSGSMQGSSIAEARNALQLALRSLRPGMHFNLVGFGSQYEALFPESREYGDDTLATAAEHVRRLDAGLGGTEILPALEFVLQQEPRAGFVRQVLLLTDGQVTNTEDVIALVRQHSTHTRVFSFGIGAGASQHLVRGVARAGEGAAEFIAPGERIEAKVLRQLRRLLAPALTEVSVEWGSGVEAAPWRVPPVFSGERLLVYGRAEKGACERVTLRGRGPSGEVSVVITPERVEAAPGTPVVGTLWARAAIRDLEEGRSRLHDRRGSLQERGNKDAVRDEIVRIAKQYGLASRETSFVAVEERLTPTQGQAQLRRIPVALTKGWGGTDQLPGTIAGAMPMAALGRRIQAARMPAPTGAPRAPMAARAAASSVFRKVGEWFGSRSQTGDPEQEPMELAMPDLAMQGTEERQATATRPLDRLIALQRADGSWELSPELAQLLGKKPEELDAVASAEGWTSKEARRMWATALALAWLEAHAALQRDEWGLLAAKAFEWLRRQASGSEPESWLRRAREVVARG